MNFSNDLNGFWRSYQSYAAGKDLNKALKRIQAARAESGEAGLAAYQQEFYRIEKSLYHVAGIKPDGHGALEIEGAMNILRAVHGFTDGQVSYATDDDGKVSVKTTPVAEAFLHDNSELIKIAARYMIDNEPVGNYIFYMPPHAFAPHIIEAARSIPEALATRALDFLTLVKATHYLAEMAALIDQTDPNLYADILDRIYKKTPLKFLTGDLDFYTVPDHALDIVPRHVACEFLKSNVAGIKEHMGRFCLELSASQIACFGRMIEKYADDPATRDTLTQTYRDVKRTWVKKAFMVAAANPLAEDALEELRELDCFTGDVLDTKINPLTYSKSYQQADGRVISLSCIRDPDSLRDGFCDNEFFTAQYHGKLIAVARSAPELAYFFRCYADPSFQKSKPQALIADFYQELSLRTREVAL